jgi:hypothetical protein
VERHFSVGVDVGLVSECVDQVDRPVAHHAVRDVGAVPGLRVARLSRFHEHIVAPDRHRRNMGTPGRFLDEYERRRIVTPSDARKIEWMAGLGVVEDGGLDIF